MDDQDELFVVVDKKDKIIGYRTRHECHHDKSLIHRAIGVVLFNNRGQVLVQKRSKNKDLYPGFYTLSASGHVDKGETYIQTATRELFEELGVRAKLKEAGKFLLETKEETEMDCLFTTTHNGPFFLNKKEVDSVKFVSLEQLRKMKPELTPFAQTSFKELNLL